MQNFYLRNRVLFFGVGFGLAAVWFFSTLIVENKISVLKTSLDESIEKEIVILSDLAVTTGKGGFNKEAEAVVSDCKNEERVIFEKLLSSLDVGLKSNELVTLNNIFNNCGHVFANRRTSMLKQMEREFSFFNDLIEKRKLIDDFDVTTVNLEKWNDLIAVEREINLSFQRMVVVQQDIISTLISGKTTKSAEVQKLLEEAEELKVKLSTATEKSSTIRSVLISK